MKKVRSVLMIILLVSITACGSQSAAETPTTHPNLALPQITTIPLPTITPEVSPVQLNLNPIFPSLKLSGKLLLILYQQTGNNLIELDLQTGNARSLFQTPENSWLSAALVSPDGTQVLLAYTPPPKSGEPQYGYTDLDLLPIQGGTGPKPFLTRSDPEESFFFPTWSPDGKEVYYTHLFRIQTGNNIRAYQNDVEAASLQGASQKIALHAVWPAITSDGSKISYLLTDQVNFSVDLYLADSDGSQQVPVFPPGSNPPIDAHLFTRDGSGMIFSMVNPQPQPTRNWLEKLFGVQVVSAHNVPSDWYRAPVSGGTPQRLTNLEEVNLNGDLSPDGSQMSFICAGGVYVMNIDGSNLVQLSNDVMIGTVDWIP